MTAENDLICRSDALKAVDNRHEELLHDPVYRRKTCQIDLLGIKKHILAIPPVEITEEQAINKLHETGWLIEHDKEMTTRSEGEWIKHIDDLFPEDSTEECPFCHEEQRLVGNDDNFCPNCGAKLKMPY